MTDCKLRCDVCGQFVSYKEMYRNLITPDSAYTCEEWETLCKACKEESIE